MSRFRSSGTLIIGLTALLAGCVVGEEEESVDVQSEVEAAADDWFEANTDEDGVVHTPAGDEDTEYSDGCGGGTTVNHLTWMERQTWRCDGSMGYWCQDWRYYWSDHWTLDCYVTICTCS